MRARLAVEEWNPAHPADPAQPAQALVLVHGLATTRWIWDLVVRQLAERRRVVTLDVPGFGESAPVGAGFELDRVAERIARGLAAHRVRGPFDLVGHSLGAAVATALAVRRPVTVRRLVLVAPAGFGAMPPVISRLFAAGADPLLAARRALLPIADFDWGRRLLLTGAAADGASIAPGVARRMVTASAGARRTAEALATIGEGRLAALLAQTTVPLGVIWGSEDRTVSSRNVSVVRQVRPDAEIELLERAGHVPMVEQPEEFVAALERLLTTLAAGVSAPATPAR